MTNARNEEGLKRVEEVARFLGVSRSHVYGLMDKGVLPFVKLGKSRRLRQQDVAALIESNLVSAQ